MANYVISFVILFVVPSLALITSRFGSTYPLIFAKISSREQQRAQQVSESVNGYTSREALINQLLVRIEAAEHLLSGASDITTLSEGARRYFDTYKGREPSWVSSEIFTVMKMSLKRMRSGSLEGKPRAFAYAR
jgi:hypothetical protein